MWSDVSSRIQAGKPMAEALAANTLLVPRSIAQMIHSGEKSGKLGHVMEQVAGYSEQELKERIADLTRYIEPAMIVLMGALIGGVALALMLPIFTISKVVAN
jgi:type IV pilus assembly protein PilC